MHIKVFLLSAILVQSFYLMSMEQDDAASKKSDGRENFFVNLGSLPVEIKKLIAMFDCKKFELSDKSGEYFVTSDLAKCNAFLLNQDKYKNIPKSLELIEDLQDEYKRACYRNEYKSIEIEYPHWLKKYGKYEIEVKIKERFKNDCAFDICSRKLKPFVVHDMGDAGCVVGYTDFSECVFYEDIPDTDKRRICKVDCLNRDFVVYIYNNGDFLYRIKPPLQDANQKLDFMAQKTEYTFIDFADFNPAINYIVPIQLKSFSGKKDVVSWKSNDKYLKAISNGVGSIIMLSEAAAYNTHGADNVELGLVLLRKFHTHKHILSSLVSDPVALYEVTQVRRSLLNTLHKKINVTKDKIELQDTLKILKDQSVFPQNIKGSDKVDMLSLRAKRLLKFD